MREWDDVIDPPRWASRHRDVPEPGIFYATSPADAAGGRLAVGHQARAPRPARGIARRSLGGFRRLIELPAARRGFVGRPANAPAVGAEQRALFVAAGLWIAFTVLLSTWLCGCGSCEQGRGLSGSPADSLPPHITRLLENGLRPDWSSDGRRLLFLDDLVGDVFELELAIPCRSPADSPLRAQRLHPRPLPRQWRRLALRTAAACGDERGAGALAHRAVVAGGRSREAGRPPRRALLRGTRRVASESADRVDAIGLSGPRRAGSFRDLDGRDRVRGRVPPDW